MLRRSTLSKAADRKRFVTPEMAEPYIHHRHRMNRQRTFRQVKAALGEVVRQPTYGTNASLACALRAVSLAQRLLGAAQALRAHPTLREAKARTADTDRLAAD